jgi:hypothetical protein
MRGSRGAIEVPAVMIFIMVAGGLILLFFFVLVRTNLSSAETGIQASSMQRLDTLLKSAGTSKNTINRFPIGDDTLNYECDDLIGSRVYYDSGVQMPTGSMVLFSPARHQGGELRTYSQAASHGYRVTTLLYLGSAGFVLQNATDLAGIPPNFAYRNISASALQSADRNQRLVVASAPGLSVPSTHPDVVIIHQQPGNIHGSVTYKQAGKPDATVHYPNKELLLGAVISSDADTYNCVLRQYLQRLRWVNGVERERFQRVQAANLNSGCYHHYQEFPYEEIHKISSDGITNINNFNLEAAEKLARATRQLQMMNDNIIRGGGSTCAWLY